MKMIIAGVTVWLVNFGDFDLALLRLFEPFTLREADASESSSGESCASVMWILSFWPLLKVASVVGNVNADLSGDFSLG